MVGYPAMAATRFRSSFARNLTFVFATMAAVHFIFSAVIWGTALYGDCTVSWMRKYLARDLLVSSPAVLLLIWFLVATLAAWLRMRIAGWLLIGGLAASAGFFAYDVATHNCQMYVDVFHATTPQKS